MLAHHTIAATRIRKLLPPPAAPPYSISVARLWNACHCIGCRFRFRSSTDVDGCDEGCAACAEAFMLMPLRNVADFLRDAVENPVGELHLACFHRIQRHILAP